jgi:hypothetical protein
VAGRRTLEDVLARLATVREDPESAASLEALRAALAGRSGAAVAKAARLVGELELAVLATDLVTAFERILGGGCADPGCTAKTAIADALYRLGHDAAGVFLRGIRHVQMEPVFGGRVDTAVDLRGACALGLVRIGYRDALLELADLTCATGWSASSAPSCGGRGSSPWPRCAGTRRSSTCSAWSRRPSPRRPRRQSRPSGCTKASRCSRTGYERRPAVGESARCAMPSGVRWITRADGAASWGERKF